MARGSGGTSTRDRAGDDAVYPARHGEAEFGAALAGDGVGDGLDEAPSVWPTRGVVELEVDLAREETRAQCAVRVREALAPEVAEAIAELGYDAFVEDLCGARAAARTGDLSACDTLSVSTARRGCRRRIAVARGLPDACPDDLALLGREPVCVAWAARDVGLCRAATGLAALRCEAVLSGDARRCARLPRNARERCVSELARYGASLGRGRADAPVDSLAPTLTFVVEGEGRDRGVPFTSHALDRGVVAARCRGRRTVALRLDHGLRASRWERTLLDTPPELAMWLLFEDPTVLGDGQGVARRVPGNLTLPLGPTAGPGSTARPRSRGGATGFVLPAAAPAAEVPRGTLRMRLPDGGERDTESPGASGMVTLHDAPGNVTRGLRRGARVEATVEATLPGPLPGDADLRVHGHLRTFVRDLLDDDPRLCPPRAGGATSRNP